MQKQSPLPPSSEPAPRHREQCWPGLHIAGRTWTRQEPGRGSLQREPAFPLPLQNLSHASQKRRTRTRTHFVTTSCYVLDPRPQCPSLSHSPFRPPVSSKEIRSACHCHRPSYSSASTKNQNAAVVEKSRKSVVRGGKSSSLPFVRCVPGWRRYRSNSPTARPWPFFFWGGGGAFREELLLSPYRALCQRLSCSAPLPSARGPGDRRGVWSVSVCLSSLFHRYF